MLPPEDLDIEEEAEEEYPTAAWLNKSCEIRMGNDGKLVGGLEHAFYDFPYIGHNNPN